jgi:addiction module HigA family antidote
LIPKGSPGWCTVEGSAAGRLIPRPGFFLNSGYREEVLEALDLTVARAAQALGVRRATLSDLLNGNAALSPGMAMRLEKAFGISMETLLRMQAGHDSLRRRPREIDVKKFRARAG